MIKHIDNAKYAEEVAAILRHIATAAKRATLASKWSAL